MTDDSDRSLPFTDKGVFFAELDDDFQQLQNLSDAELLKRITCYILLAPSIIIHPAYIWQSPMTHRLVHDTASELIRPPAAQLELGKHIDIAEYMNTRIDKLVRPRNPTRELRGYEKHGQRLGEEARLLDSRFRTAQPRDVMSSSLRDKRFRKLLKGDLDRIGDFDQISLASRLKKYNITSREVDAHENLLDMMMNFVENEELVSVDTFLRKIYDEGFPELEADKGLRRRLLGLYYETYADSQTMIPATSKLLPGQVVNRYDADIFWGVMVNLFGAPCRLLADPSDPAASHAIRQIQESSDWKNFRKIYFDTLETIDEALWEVPQHVIDRFSQTVPPKTRLYVLKALWQKRKRDLVSIAFGAIGSSTAAFSTLSGDVASGAGFAALGLGAAGIIVSIKTFIDNYRKQPIPRIRETIKHHVDRAIADANREGVID